MVKLAAIQKIRNGTVIIANNIAAQRKSSFYRSRTHVFAVQFVVGAPHD